MGHTDGVTDTVKDRGASAVEYGLMIGGITAVVVTIVFGVGTLVGHTLDDTCTALKQNTRAGTGSGCRPPLPVPTWAVDPVEPGGPGPSGVSGPGGPGPGSGPTTKPPKPPKTSSPSPSVSGSPKASPSSTHP